MSVNGIFGLPFYHSNIENRKLLNDQLYNVYHQIESNNGFDYYPGYSPSHLLSGFQKNILELYDCSHFENEIRKHIAAYLRDIRSDVTLDNTDHKIQAWMTVNKKNHYAMVHSHGTTDLAGVYYLKSIPKGGRIFFRSPLKQLSNSRCFTQIPEVITHTPDEGKILIFPGWLEHGVETSESDDIRISIAFNVNFYPTIKENK